MREVVVRVVHTICSSKDKASLTMMRGLKAMQDPHGILNSYKVLPSASPCASAAECKFASSVAALQRLHRATWSDANPKTAGPLSRCVIVFT